mgnify:CR=1 FL=1
MKKSKIAILSIVALTATLVIGGTIMTVQNRGLFSDGNFDFRSPKKKQLAYLKKHEEEMAEFVKSRNPKVKSVQFDWDSMTIEDIGNGTPQGGGYVLTLSGGINNIEDSEFTLGFPLEHNRNSTPDIKRISEMQPIRVLKGNVWDIYE